MCLSVRVGIGNWYQKMGISIDYAITVIVTYINKLVRLPNYFSLFLRMFNKRHKNNSEMLTSQVVRWFKFTLKPPYSIACGKLRLAIWDTSFYTFCSNLDTRDLDTYPRTYSGHFWNMSIFDNSRAVWVLFRKWVVSENQSFLDEGAIITPPYQFSFRRRGP